MAARRKGKFCLRSRSTSWFIVLLTSLLIQAPPALAEDGVRGNLVTAEWLERNLERPEVLVIDASPAHLYKAQHIPGAVSADLFGFGARPVPAAELEKRYQSWGISPGKKIVVYDQGTPMWATRLFFDLYYRGFPAQNLFLLDGGFSKWKEVGGAVSKDPAPAPAKGRFRIAGANEEVRVRLPEFLIASGDRRNHALIDALDPEYHFGAQQFFDRPGHVPHGILLPSADFYNPDRTFKSADEIRRMLDYHGVRPEQEVHTYCGGGIAASVPFFAIRFIAGYPKVKLFAESELGWLQDDRGLPFWTYAAPYLMRETDWLKSWGGPMMRMFGVSQLSVIDVRPADAYQRGRVPYAVNIPAETFRTHLGNPRRLAEILGAAGVGPAHEAVVVSGAGLDARSALAFLALESLGQRRVSVFLDSMDKSAQRGFYAAKEGAAAAKSPPEVPPVPRTYSLNPRESVVIADPASTKGLYPRVFIASGTSVPLRAPEGRVVHLPYTDLLEADGRPRSAKEIWSRLVKAGVPRYAELLAFSDDPGEAAANYFLLKLMGFPDVKVLHR